jgi:hypothetical protein
VLRLLLVQRPLMFLLQMLLPLLILVLLYLLLNLLLLLVAIKLPTHCIMLLPVPPLPCVRCRIRLLDGRQSQGRAERRRLVGILLLLISLLLFLFLSPLFLLYFLLQLLKLVNVHVLDVKIWKSRASPNCSFVSTDPVFLVEDLGCRSFSSRPPHLKGWS